MMLVLKQHSLH